jgi:hypothetical protein
MTYTDVELRMRIDDLVAHGAPQIGAALTELLALRQERDALQAKLTEANNCTELWHSATQEANEQCQRAEDDNTALRENCRELEPRALTCDDEWIVDGCNDLSDIVWRFHDFDDLAAARASMLDATCRIVRIPVPLAAAEPVAEMARRHGLPEPSPEVMRERLDRETGKRVAAEPAGEPEKPVIGGYAERVLERLCAAADSVRPENASEAAARAALGGLHVGGFLRDDPAREKPAPWAPKVGDRVRAVNADQVGHIERVDQIDTESGPVYYTVRINPTLSVSTTCIAPAPESPITPEPERERQMRREWNAEGPPEPGMLSENGRRLHFCVDLGADKPLRPVTLHGMMSLDRSDDRRRMAVEIARWRTGDLPEKQPEQPDAPGEANLRKASGFDDFAAGQSKEWRDGACFKKSSKSAAAAEQIEKLRASGAIIQTAPHAEHWLARTAERDTLRTIAEECNEPYIRGLALDALLGPPT